VPQRKTIYADILSKEPPAAAAKTNHTDPSQGDEPERAALVVKGHAEKSKPKGNKATDPEYVKLTAYIPRDLHSRVKIAMAQDRVTDQSTYIEKWIEEKLAERGSTPVSKRHRATE
jgi:hypothetical protein